MAAVNTTTESNLSSFDSYDNATMQYYSAFSEKLEFILRLSVITITFIAMMSLGCTMEVSKIKDHFIKPKGVATGVVAQFGIMPLTAFCLAKLFRLGSIESVTVLICGCCPGGALSNVIALAVQGDMNLSIVMTTCSTVLGLGLMPLMIYLYSQGFRNLENSIPFTGIIISLILILVPCGLGILLNYYVPKYSKTITRVGLSFMGIVFVIMGILAGVIDGNRLSSIATPPILAIAVLMPLSGYICGYFLSGLFRMNAARTVSVETGCQNVNLCITILKVAFPPEVIGQLYLFPAVYLVFQLAEVFLFITVFRCYQRLRHQQTSEKETKTYTAFKRQTAGNKEPSDNVFSLIAKN